MLYAVDSGRKITRMPHAGAFRSWCGGLTAGELGSIRAALRTRLAGGDVHTAAWVPGKDWTNKVYAPIYRVCGRGTQDAGNFFGLLFWEAAMTDEAWWSFARCAEGMRYFRLQAAP